MDVAGLVEQAVTDPTTRGRILEIGGPEDFSFNQLGAAIQQAAGRPAAPRHVPPLMLRLMARSAGIPQARAESPGTRGARHGPGRLQLRCDRHPPGLPRRFMHAAEHVPCPISRLGSAGPRPSQLADAGRGPVPQRPSSERDDAGDSRRRVSAAAKGARAEPTAPSDRTSVSWSPGRVHTLRRVRAQRATHPVATRPLSEDPVVVAGRDLYRRAPAQSARRTLPWARDG